MCGRKFIQPSCARQNYENESIYLFVKVAGLQQKNSSTFLCGHGVHITCLLGHSNQLRSSPIFTTSFVENFELPSVRWENVLQNLNR